MSSCKFCWGGGLDMISGVCVCGGGQEEGRMCV